MVTSEKNIVPNSSMFRKSLGQGKKTNSKASAKRYALQGNAIR